MANDNKAQSIKVYCRIRPLKTNEESIKVRL